MSSHRTAKTVLDGGEAIVQGLRNLGIEHVFCSPGSEWGPVWEAFARQTAGRIPGPVYHSCGHETLAVDLALGYTMVTGRMQAVLLHAGSGLMHGSMAVQSALASETPMIVMSGESLSYGEDERFDPGAQWYAYLGVVGGPQSLIEPFVKWCSHATSPATLHEMVIRAGELARRTPAGPTYLSVPVETLAQPWSAPAKMRMIPPAPRPQAPASDVERVAELLLNARNPVITTESGGREPLAYERLRELAELLAIPVVESAFSTVANFPKDHLLHQGFDLKPVAADADLVLVVRNRVPWYPPGNAPKNATVVVIDEAPFKTTMVYQNLQADVYLEGDVPSSLGGLAEALRAACPDPARTSARMARWAAEHERSEERRRSEIEKARRASGIHPANLCATLGEVLPGNTIYVDETTTYRDHVHRYVAYHGPHGFVRTPSGLGQSLGFSLGMKLASPSRPVVTLLGDGAFLYNPVVPSLGFAAEAKLPLMVVVFNNGGYQSMKKNQLRAYPGGAGAEHELFYGASLAGARYDELATPFGGIGIRVRDAAELRSGLRQAHAAVDDGKTAIVNVVLER